MSYVTGFTHSDGYALCPTHAEYGEMIDTDNESGKVQAIFDTDEWDYIPTCDVCNEEIETVVLDYSEDYELVIGITINIRATSESEAKRLVVKAMEEHGLPVLEYSNGYIVTSDES